MAKKTSKKPAPKAPKSAPARRSVALATPPNAFDDALIAEDSEPAPAAKTTPAARPVGKLLTLPVPTLSASSEYDLDELDEEEDAERERVAIRQESALTETGVGPKSKSDFGMPTAAKGGKAVNAAFWEQSEKLGPAFAKAITTRKMRTRIERIYKAVSRWELGGQPEMEKAFGALESALAQLGIAAGLFEDVPRDWRPGKSRKAQGEGAKLLAGATVAIREKLRGSYVEALEEETAALETLTVVRHAKTKVVVRTPAGLNYVIPRGHLIVIPSASP